MYTQLTWAAQKTRSGTGVISGTVDNIFWSDPVAGRWGFSLYDDLNNYISVFGDAITLAEGVHVTCTGVWKQGKRGDTYLEATKIELENTDSLEGLVNVLKSGMVWGINEALTARLISTFGRDVNVLKEVLADPEKLQRVPGIGPATGPRISQSWREVEHYWRAVALICPPLTTKQALRAFSTLGTDLSKIITENPYKLMFVPGIAFSDADRVARERFNISIYDMRRIAAGIAYSIKRACGPEGHSWVSWNQLSSMAQGELAIGNSMIAYGIYVAACDGDIVLTDENGKQIATSDLNLFSLPTTKLTDAKVRVGFRIQKSQPWWKGMRITRHVSDYKYYNASLYRAEVRSAKRLLDLMSVEPNGTDQQRTEWQWPDSLDEYQQQALEVAISEPVSVITGGPGTGKSTTIRSLTQQVMAVEGHIPMILAPTGKAAKRVTEIMKEGGINIEGSTIHRALEYDGATFARGEDYPLDAQTVIVDETSMVDIGLMAHLVSALTDGTRLVLVGDVDQLPSVGPGAVLQDLISGGIPTVYLKENHRQQPETGKPSEIVRLAEAIKTGRPFSMLPLESREPSDLYEYVFNRRSSFIDQVADLVTRVIPDRFGFKQEDIQVITPRNATRRQLNAKLRDRINPSVGTRTALEKYVRVGDYVMQLKNWYNAGGQGIHVFNGDTGYVTSITSDGKYTCVTFDVGEVWYTASELNNLTHAYAMTIHKSQGSEFPAVVVVLTHSDTIMLRRRLLYTAVTRGKRLVVIAQEPGCTMRATKNTVDHKRQTGLRQMISEVVKCVYV